MTERMFDTGRKEYRPDNEELQPRAAQCTARRGNDRRGVAGAARAVFAGVGEAGDE